MPGIVSRWINSQTKILGVRFGPGALKLPREVTRIHMDFARTNADGHMGPRRFWRLYLPRLKFHNSHVPMIVNRGDDNSGPATMSIYMRTDDSSSSSSSDSGPRPAADLVSSAYGMSKAPEPTGNERVVTIDMKGKQGEDILDEFAAAVGAEPVEHGEEAEGLVRAYEERKGALERQREHSAAEKVKRDEATRLQGLAKIASD